MEAVRVPGAEVREGPEPVREATVRGLAVISDGAPSSSSNTSRSQ